MIFANIDDQNIQKILPAAKCKIVTFSSNQNLLLKPDWYLLRESRPLPTIIKNIKSRQDNLVIIPFERKIIGSFNDANMLAAAVVAAELGIKQTAIMAGLSTYDGIQRRLQIRARHDEALVIDDFGSTPAKAAACLATVRQEYPKHYLVPIFEPNAGNRGARTLELFKQVFNNADLVILPKFTLLPKATELRFSENDLWELLNEAGVKTEYFPIDADVISEIKQLLAKKKKIIIIFIGSHSFRGMIPKVCEALLNVKGKKTTKVK
jgi:UDP-N-acetylmuramate-alanine ligase